jgi:hypothetical protein
MRVPEPAGAVSADDRYVSYFHELDAWTEYWDVYHPETRGRFYFGNGEQEKGLLTRFLPRETVPAVFLAWKRYALYEDSEDRFRAEARQPDVAEAVLTVDELVASIFARHFGDAADVAVQEDYLEAIFRFAIDTLPAAPDRDSLIPADDPRKPTAGRHTLEGDLMWFAWALHLEAAYTLRGGADSEHSRRALLMAGIATGCAANFAWRGHRRTRPEYRSDEATAALLRKRGLAWSRDFSAGASEVHALFRIREWGEA